MKSSTFLQAFLGAACIGTAVFFLLLKTAEILPLTWDEGDAMERVDRLLTWEPFCSKTLAKTALKPNSASDLYPNSVSNTSKNSLVFQKNSSVSSENNIRNQPKIESSNVISKNTSPNSDHWIKSWASVPQKPFWSSEPIKNSWISTTVREGHPGGYIFISAVGKKFCDSCRLTAKISEKVRYRFGAIFCFSLAMGAVFYRMSRDFNAWTGLFSVASILLIPRVFAHAQIAACDSVLMSFWLLAWTAFIPALRHRFFTLIWGIFLGATFSMKFTGFCALIPFLLFLCFLGLQKPVQNIINSRQIARKNSSNISKILPDSNKTAVLSNVSSIQNNLSQNCLFYGKKLLYFPKFVFFVLFCQKTFWTPILWGIPTAILTFYLLNPPLWSAPIQNLQTFFSLNLNRKETFNISLLFLGKIYDLNHPLPWYNTVFWTAITLPLGMLFLSGLGILRIFFVPTQKTSPSYSNSSRHSDSFDSFNSSSFDKTGSDVSLQTEQTKKNQKIPQTTSSFSKRSLLILILLNALTLLIIRALPGTPPHDGVRMFIVSFPFLGILSGVGTMFFIRLISERQTYFNQKTADPSSKKNSDLKPKLITKSNSVSNSCLISKLTTVYRSFLRLYLHKIRINKISWRKIVQKGLTFGCIGILYLGFLFNLYWYCPQWLAFYSPLIGGLPGAEKRGMEPTYWWDACDRSVLDWLNKNTNSAESKKYQLKSNNSFNRIQTQPIQAQSIQAQPIQAQSVQAQTPQTQSSKTFQSVKLPSKIIQKEPIPTKKHLAQDTQVTAYQEKVRFSASSALNWNRYRNWKEIQFDFEEKAPGKYRWYVVQRRPSGLSLVDRRLIENTTPVYRKTIRNGGWKYWDLSQTPLIEIYDYRDAVLAYRQLKQEFELKQKQQQPVKDKRKIENKEQNKKNENIKR